MELEELLRRDRAAATLFSHLPFAAQKEIRQTGRDIGTLAALRERAIGMIQENGPFYANCVVDGTQLEPEEKAEWTKEHET